MGERNYPGTQAVVGGPGGGHGTPVGMEERNWGRSRVLPGWGQPRKRDWQSCLGRQEKRQSESIWSLRSQGRRGFKGGFKEFQSLSWRWFLLQSTGLQGVEGREETPRSGWVQTENSRCWPESESKRRGRQEVGGREVKEFVLGGTRVLFGLGGWANLV